MRGLVIELPTQRTRPQLFFPFPSLHSFLSFCCCDNFLFLSSLRHLLVPSLFRDSLPFVYCPVFVVLGNIFIALNRKRGINLSRLLSSPGKENSLSHIFQIMSNSHGSGSQHQAHNYGERWYGAGQKVSNGRQCRAQSCQVGHPG